MQNKSILVLLSSTLILLSFSGDHDIVPDDYPVTKKMLSEFYTNKNIDNVVSFINVWFKNDDLKEILIFELYTDLFRYKIYHIKSDFLFNDLIKQIELLKKTGEDPYDYVRANDSLKLQTIHKFFESSTEIDKCYFRTIQGVSLGIKKSESIKKYGKPNSDSLINNVEILKWNFQSENYIAETHEKPKWRIVKGSYGYHVIMYFQLDKLVAMILINDPP